MPPKKKLKVALAKVLAQAENRRIQQYKNQTYDENRLRQKQNAYMKSNGISKKALKKQRKQENTTEEQATTETNVKADIPRPRPLIKFHDYDRVLLIGEGNFSFAASLVNQYYLSGAERLTATCFDSEQVLYEKYGDEAKENVELARTMGATVLFDVDGTKLDKNKLINKDKYSKIIFNFPHAGKGIKDEQRNIESNQALLTDFFKAATPLLTHQDDKQTDTGYDHDERDDTKVDGEIYVTVKTGKPYDEWKIKFVAKWTGLLALRTSIPFRPSDYPGYCHRRTIGFKKGISKEDNEEIMKSDPRTFIFVRKQVMDVEIEKAKHGKIVAAKQRAAGKKAKKRGRQEEGDDEEDEN
ncbi:uncharacterized protein BX664DRAFT_339370 [Halteromyces radiatus]|uniref:uncharacterized protein n=1 Tax=Halteromyces radiatus TaxID=101107 RepID=UPI00221E9E99|nr:uncharacterized protein BX664DRAFT_339370 [Halteromyces radiatus]KAI8082899.1 hypothetical protein BX664DRAFT_339370 [Halteromyces radiatus]